MRKLLTAVLVLLLSAALFGCAPSAPTASGAQSSPAASSNKTATLTIMAASSLTSPLNEIISAYAPVQPAVKVIAVYGGSGALQKQIEEGAPADIFFSAAVSQMDALDKKGLIVASSKVNLLTNEIVLVVPADQPVKIGGFGDVATDAAAKIALGDPKSVPAGQYAQEMFTFLKIWDKVSAKATYGSDVKQVLSWVASGNVDCGIVYKSDALADKNLKMIAEAQSGSHAAIVYPVAVVKASANQKPAADFVKYLTSKDAAAVFTKYGFLTA